MRGSGKLMCSRPLQAFEKVDVLLDVYVNVNTNLTLLRKKRGSHAPLQLIKTAFSAAGRDWRCGHRQSDQPYRYFGNHSVSPGQMYMNTMQRITINMYGIMPAKIWLSVTCGGDTPLR